MSKVLIVDDDQFIRELYEEVLKDGGFEVDTASDGEEGLSKLQKGGYSVTLLDVMMPKKNGLEVLKELQSHPSSEKNSTIILLTNLAQDPIVQDALSHGASSYLIKTDMTPDQILSEVKKHAK